MAKIIQFPTADNEVDDVQSGESVYPGEVRDLVNYLDGARHMIGQMPYGTEWELFKQIDAALTSMDIHDLRAAQTAAMERDADWRF